MKEQIKFIKNTTIFLLIFIVIFIALGNFYNSKIFIKKNVYRANRQFIESNHENLKILFLGDSHPLTDINPLYIPNTFNYASTDETYEQTYYKLKKILQENNNIEILVFPLDLHSFTDYREKPYSDIRYWLKFMTIKELAKVTGRFTIRLYIDNLCSFVGKGFDFKRIFFDVQKTEINKGWNKYDGLFEEKGDLEDVAFKRIELQFRLYPEIINENLLNSLLKILDLAENNNKIVVFIKYPLTKEYILAIKNKGIDIDDYYSRLESYILKYPNIYLFDYQDLFDNSFFTDEDHLNVKGSEIFSKQVSEDLQSIK